MAVTQNFILDMIPGDVPLVVKVSQYDVQSRIINFDLFQGDTPYVVNSGTVSVRGGKPDGTAFEYSCSRSTNISGGTRVSMTVEEQMTILNGNIPCELRISAGSQILGTANFILYVEKSPMNEEAISETELPLLMNVAEEAKQSAANAQTYASNAATSAENALRTADEVYDLVDRVSDIVPSNQGQLNDTLVSDGQGGATWKAQIATAQNVEYTPTGNITANTVQGAIDELVADINSIGTTTSSQQTSVNIASNTLTTMGSVTLEPGTYLLIGFGQFAKNATGYREIGISTSTSLPSWNQGLRIFAGTNVGNQIEQTVRVVKIVEETTFNMIMYHTAGTALVCYGRIEAIKLN